MQSELVAISSLSLDPANVRKHPDKNIQSIIASLKRFGQQKPIVVDANGIVRAGNGTLMAAKQLGYTEIAIVRSPLKGSEATAYAIADNRTAELAEWDEGSLAEQLAALQIEDEELALATGFDEADIDALLAPDEVIEDEVPEPPVDAITKSGDVWLLGSHRVMCGDSTSADDVARLMRGENANITFTSPPYNAASGSFLNGRVKGFANKYKTHDDDLTDDEYRDFLARFTTIALDKSDFVFVNIQLLAHNRIPLSEYQYQFRNKLKDILIWNKKQCPPNIVRGAFNTKWEYVICYSHNNKTRGFPVSWQGQHSNVIETESNSSNEFSETHKAGFPVAFPVWIIDRLEFAKLIYDPFLGTGTTLIAADQLNRKCYGMEISPQYCDVVVARWEKLTGKKAQLETV